MKNKEKVIRYLLRIERKYANNQLSVDVGRGSYSNSDISDLDEEEFIKQLSILEADGLITVKFNAGHRDLRYGISVVLHSGIVNYFDNKKSKRRTNRRDKIKTYIPIIISTFALLKSYGIDIILLCKQLLRLLLKK